MRREAIEVHGRTVEEAVAAGLAQLGLASDQVRVAVLDAGSKGFLGLGARDAIVSLTPFASVPDQVREAVTEVLAAGGFAADVEVAWDATARTVSVAVTGDELGALIGRHGRTLDALELLLNLACCRSSEGPRQLVLDVGGYRERRCEVLQRMALRAAEIARRERRPVSLEAMPARERRVVHLALQDAADITTRSEGEDPARYVIVEPREQTGL